jgi:hypothetical protein
MMRPGHQTFQSAAVPPRSASRRSAFAAATIFYGDEQPKPEASSTVGVIGGRDSAARDLRAFDELTSSGRPPTERASQRAATPSESS